MPPSAEPRTRDLLPLEDRPRSAQSSVDIDGGRSVVIAPPGADEIEVNFRGVLLESGSVYAQEQLSIYYDELVGETISLARVYQIAYDIQERYREDGYLLTRVVVPEQTVSDGVFRLRIVEGFISTVRVEGDAGKLQRRIQAYLGEIRGLAPVDRQTLERYLLLVNDLPGVTAKGVLRPAAGEPGASDLVLRVQRTPFEALALANNRGSRFTGPQRAMLVGRANSPFGGGEQFELLALTAFDSDEQRFGQLLYRQPFGAEGWSLDVLASYGPSEPGSALASLDLETRSTRFDVSLSYPLLRSRHRNLSVRFGFEAADLDVESLGQIFSSDRLRVFHAGSYFGFEGRGGARNQLGVGLRQGLSAFGASEKGSPELSRTEGKSDFTSVQAHASRFQRLAGRFDLLLSVRGQYAFDTLLSDEEFLLGGEQSGRGYDPAELAGEHGLAFTAELQRSARTGLHVLPDHQIYGFYDLGAVWNEDTGVERRQSLASAGVGWRARILRNFDIGLEVAQPLTRTVAAEGDRDPRFFLQLSARM